MSVVGESFHQDALLAVLSSNGRHVRATLVPEPNNPYDENAVKIVIDGHDVGHLSRDVARRFVSVLARQAAPIVVPAELRGGEPGKPTIGVTLNFEAVYALPRSRKPRKTKGAT